MQNERDLLKRLIKSAQQEPKGETNQQEDSDENKAAENAPTEPFHLKTVDEIIKENERANPTYKE